LATNLKVRLDLDQRLRKFSKWTVAVQAVAVLQKLLNKESDCNIQKAESTIMKLVQLSHFSDEIQSLKSGTSLKKSSTISQLDPFLDQQGILRIGGRLQESLVLSFNLKHPILIPKSTHLATLIIRHYHTLSAHQG